MALMDRKAKELAVAGLDIYSRELSPLYDMHRRELLAELSIRNTTVEDLAARERNDTENAEIITRFVKHLPPTSHISKQTQRIVGYQWDVYTQAITTTDPYEARTVMSSVIWLRQGRYIKGEQPYYVVGERKSSRRSKELLIVSAATTFQTDEQRLQAERFFDEVDQMYIFSPRGRDLKSIRTGSRFNSANAPETVRRMFNLDDHLLYVTPPSSGAQVIENDEKRLKRVVRLSDEELALFNVFDRLNDIATAFRKEEELKAIILGAHPQIKESPRKKLSDCLTTGQKAQKFLRSLLEKAQASSVSK